MIRPGFCTARDEHPDPTRRVRVEIARHPDRAGAGFPRARRIGEARPKRLDVRRVSLFVAHERVVRVLDGVDRNGHRAEHGFVAFAAHGRHQTLVVAQALRRRETERRVETVTEEALISFTGRVSSSPRDPGRRAGLADALAHQVQGDVHPVRVQVARREHVHHARARARRRIELGTSARRFHASPVGVVLGRPDVRAHARRSVRHHDFNAVVALERLPPRIRRGADHQLRARHLSLDDPLVRLLDEGEIRPLALFVGQGFPRDGALGVALERLRGAALLLGRPGHQLAVDRVRDRARRERQALPGGPESRDHAHRRKSHANGRHLRARVRSAFACARVLGNPMRLGDLAASRTPLARLLARTDDARLPPRARVFRETRARWGFREKREKRFLRNISPIRLENRR